MVHMSESKLRLRVRCKVSFGYIGKQGSDAQIGRRSRESALRLATKHDERSDRLVITYGGTLEGRSAWTTQ